MEIGRITKIGRGGELFAGDSAQGSRGKGDRTISNAEVSIPLSPGRQAFVFGYCCPIPLTPWLAAPRVVAARKKEAFASLGVSTSFLLPYTEHPPQNGSDDSGGTQDDDLHEDTFLSICNIRRSAQARRSGYCQYMPLLPSGRKYPQNLPRTIDTSPILWYPIIKPLLKGARLCKSPKPIPLFR